MKKQFSPKDLEKLHDQSLQNLENEEENITASNSKNIAPRRIEISEELYQKLANLQQKKEDGSENDNVKVIENKKKISELLIHQKRTIEILRVENLRFSEQKEALELARREQAVSTVQGKEVIQAKISQELVEVKATFENLKISEVSSEENRKKLTKKLERVEQTSVREIDLGDVFFSNVPLLSNLVPGNVAGNVAKKFKTEMLKEEEKMVKKLVEKATADLERQRKKAVKKIDTLIKVRDKEVKGAQEVISKMESVISELKKRNEAQAKEGKEEIQQLKILSDGKLANLQESIKKLTGELKKFEEKEKDTKNFLNRQRQAIKEKASKSGK